MPRTDTRKAWQLLDENASIIREVVASAEGIAADLGGNSDSRLRQTSGGGFIMIEEARVRRLVAAVRALNFANLPCDAAST